MENNEASVSSSATRTWHDFLERMRQPSATEFVRNIKNFIVSLSSNAPDPETDSASIQEFFSKTEANFRAHPLWAGRTEEELDNAGEGLEKYIMTKLFNRVFASHPDDVKIDNEFSKKTSLIQQFIRPEQLDIQPIYQNATAWLQAQKELQKINSYKAPRDKLACILSCCKVISNSLFNDSVFANENPPGADDFLPVLIYVTIKANPPQFHSNLMYIQRYRNKTRLLGEAGYVFTNMLSAESFILNMDAKSLSMDETEFLKNMESAQILVSGTAYNGENMQGQGGQSQTVSESKLKEVLSVSDLESKGATELLTEEKVIEKFQNFPYLYSRAGELTIGDVEDLLNNYKQLVFKYVCFAKGLGVPVVPPRTPEPRNGGEAGEVISIESGEEGLGVAAPPLKTQISGGDTDSIEGDRKESEMVDALEPRGQVDDVEGGRNDNEVDSIPESITVAGDVSQIEENAKK